MHRFVCIAKATDPILDERVCIEHNFFVGDYCNCPDSPQSGRRHLLKLEPPPLPCCDVCSANNDNGTKDASQAMIAGIVGACAVIIISAVRDCPSPRKRLKLSGATILTPHSPRLCCSRQ